jgi:hypothetical protein
MTVTSEKAVSQINQLNWKRAYAQAARTLVNEGWFPKHDERATDPPGPLPPHGIASAGIRHLSAIIAQLDELRTLDESDEYGRLRASKQTYDQACDLLIDGAIIAGLEGREIPYGGASTDSEGGIRIEWVRPTSGVHLVIPSGSSRSASLYHETGEEYAVEPATAEGLARWLRLIGD